MLQPSSSRDRLDSRVIRLLAAAIASLAFVGPAGAQTLTWSGTGSFNGPGTWNSSNSNWWNGTANQTWTTGNTAAFGVSTGTGSTVTVSGSVSAGGIVFNPLSVSGNTAGSSFTLTGGTIGIGGGNSILSSGTLAGTRNGLHTITSTLVGSNLSFGRAPGGSTSTTANVGVVLNGNNPNLTGTLTVGGTTLLLANATAVSGISTINVQDGSSFGANADGSFASNIQLGANASLAGNVAAGTWTGTIALMGDGALLSGNGQPIQVFQGPIVDSSGGTAKTLNLTKRGILVFTGSSTFSGTYVLNGVNSAFGATAILDGGNNRLAPGSSFSIQAANQVLVLGTSAAVNQTFANFSSNSTGSTSSVQGGASGTSTLTVNLATGTSTFFGSLGGTRYQDGSISGGGFITNNNGNNLALVKSGAGTFILSGSSSYVGGTQINGGVLNVGNASALGTVGTISFGGGTLQFSGSNQADYSSRFSTAANQAYSLDTNGQTVSLATALTSVGGSLAKLGTGTLALSAANTFDGGTVVGNGSLVLDGGNNRLLQTGALTIGSSGAAGRLVLGGTGAVSQTVGSLATTGSGGSVVGGNASTSTLVVNLTTGSTTFAGSLGGVGTNENNLAFEKRGAGTLTLSGSSSLTGGVTLTAGQLNINQNNALGGAASLFTIAGGTLDNTSGSSVTVAANNAQNWNGDFTFAGSGPLNLGTGAVTMNASRQVTVTSSTLTVGGGITGSAFGLTKSGTGTLVLSSSNSFTGGLILNAGTIVAGNNSALGTGTMTLNSGVLSQGNGSNIANTLNVLGTGSLAVTGNAQIGTIVGSGTLTVVGTGVNQSTLVAMSGFSGQLVGSNIVLRALGAGSSSASAMDLVLSDNASFNVAGLSGTAQIGALTGTDSSSLQAGNGAVTYAIGGLNRATEFQGIIRDSGTVTSLTKVGTGVLTLSGSNTFTGATSITAGRLDIGQTGSLNNTSGITVNGSTAEFKYNSATALTRPLTLTRGTLSGTGSIGSAVSVGSNAILSPGNSPGSQAFTNGLTFAPGGQYTWEINDWAGSPGTGYDQLVVSGSALNITATSGSTFKIAITGLTAGNVAGLVPGFNGAAGTSFTIATSAAGITGFDKSDFTVDRSGFTNTLPTNAGFWVSQSGNNLLLNYAPSATYDLSANATSAAIRVGGTSWITATVTSSTAAVTNPDSVVYGGLALSGSSLGSLSSTSGTLAAGLTGSGSAAFTPGNSGSYAFSPSLSTATNANIGTNAIAGSTSGVSVTVWNPAAANAISGTLNLGTVLKGGVLSQALSIQNTAPNNGFSEKLDAGFGTLAGVTTNSGSISLLGPQATDTSTMVVGLSTATAGGKTGSAEVNFWTNGQGTSGLAPLQLASQTVSLTGTVLDPAVASFTSGSAATASLLLDFGDVNQNASITPLAFSLYNLMQTNGYTADLALLNVVSGTGNTSTIATTLPSQFFNLASGSSFAYSASLSTASLGTFQNVYTLQFNSANNGAAFNADATQNLTLTVKGVVIVPEPGAIALAGVGVGLAGWSLWKRRRTTA